MGTADSNDIRRGNRLQPKYLGIVVRHHPPILRRLRDPVVAQRCSHILSQRPQEYRY